MNFRTASKPNRTHFKPRPSLHTRSTLPNAFDRVKFNVCSLQISALLFTLRRGKSRRARKQIISGHTRKSRFRHYSRTLKKRRRTSPINHRSFVKWKTRLIAGLSEKLSALTKPHNLNTSICLERENHSQKRCRGEGAKKRFPTSTLWYHLHPLRQNEFVTACHCFKPPPPLNKKYSYRPTSWLTGIFLLDFITTAETLQLHAAIVTR